MRLLQTVAGFVLLFELPIPIYWFILHPFNSFWRKRTRLAMLFAAIMAWTAGGVFLWHFHRYLFRNHFPSVPAIAAGLALIAVEGYLLVRVERELGTRRLIGQAELSGTGELLSDGLYAHVRHPRYAGMFAAVVGAALLAGTSLLWVGLLVWWPFALIAISLEEKELATRFGPSYDAYRQRVPAFLPFRIHSERKI